MAFSLVAWTVSSFPSLQLSVMVGVVSSQCQQARVVVVVRPRTA